MIKRLLLLVCFVYAAEQATGSSDDKFIKKYAMMKIYESCFGPEVVKQIRQEMKQAYAKCSSAPSFEPPQNHHIPQVLLGKLPPGFAMDPNTQTITKPGDGALPNLDDFQQMNPEHGSAPKAPPAILAFRPQSPMYQQQAAAVPPYMQSPQYRPFSQATPFYQFPYGPGMFYQGGGGGGGGYNPYQTYQQYPQAYYQQPAYYGSNRMSRDMDLRERLDLISHSPAASAAAGKVRNITCVMQELGYIDHRLEPNYEAITERISNLPVSTELKGDIQDGLQFCQKFSQCVPDIKRNVAPLSQELVKPMFFFRCYKHKKLEACIMKDIRERFTSEDELEAETDFRSLGRSARAVRDENLNDPRFDALDEMAVYLYDYLSGGNGFDFDLF